MVIGIFTYLLKVVVFAAYAEAFLAVDHPAVLWLGQSQIEKAGA